MDFHTRAVEIQGSEGQGEDKRYFVSFSSETPYLKYDPRAQLGFRKYWEILGHKEGQFDLRFFEHGGSLLLNHDKNQQVGIIEDVFLEDSKLRGWMRFSKSDKGQEVRQDIEDGIRKYLSVGHTIEDFEILGEANGVPVIKITRWAPKELSIVFAPADLSVGAHKMTTLESEEEEMTRREQLEKILAEKDGQELEDAIKAYVSEIEEESEEGAKEAREAEAEEDADEDTEEEGGADEDTEEERDADEEVTGEKDAGGEIHQRTALFDTTKIRSKEMADNTRAARLANLAHEYNRSADLSGWIESNRSVESVLEEILDSTSNAHSSVQGDMSEKEREEMSLTSAFRGLLQGGNSLLNEMGVDAARESGVQSPDKDSLYVPLHTPIYPIHRRVLQASQGPGENLVGVQYLSIVDALREVTLMGELGIQQIDGKGALVEFPRIDGIEAEFIGEDGEVTPTQQNTSKVQLKPHMLVADVPYTNIFAELDGTYSNEDMVRRDSLGAMMEGLEFAVHSADGTGASPFGLNHNPLIPSVAAKTEEGPLTFADFVELARLAAKNKAPKRNQHYVVSPDVYADALTTTRFGAGTALPIISENNTVNGRPIRETNFVEGYRAVFGNFENVLVCTWGALQFNVNRSRQSNRRRVILEATLLMDTDVRQPKALVRHLGLRHFD